jgi:glycosyltransferase involved in cell wall biosynthesis
MNILFVSHAANRSGAPLVLLELLRYLKRQTSHQASVLSLREGPLNDEFAKEATLLTSAAALVRASKIGAAQRRVHSSESVPLMRFDPLLDAVERLNLRGARGAARGLEGQFDLVYLNSVASGDVVPGLEPILKTTPLVTHVHELGYAIDGLKTAFDAVRKRSRLFIAASDATHRHLVESHGIAKEKVETVHEFIDFSKLRVDRALARAQLRAQLGVPDDAFLVGGCGTMEWRKGADLWAYLAAQTKGAHFVWLGGQKNAFWHQVDFDLCRMKPPIPVHFLAPTTNPVPFFAGLDAFALTSREDPFPLVGIEAAAQGVPLLCFDGAGGMKELVEGDAGFVSPYGDVATMARQIELWQSDEDLCRALGKNAARRAIAMCDVQVGAPQVVALLERLVTR